MSSALGGKEEDESGKLLEEEEKRIKSLMKGMASAGMDEVKCLSGLCQSDYLHCVPCTLDTLQCCSGLNCWHAVSGNIASCFPV